MVIIIEGDSDPSIKTEALQPVEEITMSPATLEQINLEVTKDKSSDCGTVASPHREKEPNWGTSPRTEGMTVDSLILRNNNSCCSIKNCVNKS